MIPIPVGTRMRLAAGVTETRRGFASLAAQGAGARSHAGHLFVVRGRQGDLVKVIWYDGPGSCLFAKRLEKGGFAWPAASEGKVAMTPARRAMLLEG